LPKSSGGSDTLKLRALVALGFAALISTPTIANLPKVGKGKNAGFTPNVKN
jgi:hypothetical protein